MPLLIRGGRIITATRDERADVYAADETISRIEPSISATSLPPDTVVVDATNRLVFPGFIDPHVHIHLPFMGTNAADDHDTATQAALAGGTTTVIEMICPGPQDEPLSAFESWRQLAAAKAHCDFTFHQAVVRFDALAREQLRGLVQSRGVASFKVFLAYKGALDISDSDLLALLEMSRDLGVIVTAHCENADAVAHLQAAMIAAGNKSPKFHEPSRPVWVEADGVNHFATFAGLTRAHGYIVHTSCDAALQQAALARGRGVSLWVEAVIPHLVLDASHVERPDFEGAKFVMSPPLRTKADQDALWRAVASREVSTIGTDHAPFHFGSQKQLGRCAEPAGSNAVAGRTNAGGGAAAGATGDFTKIPNGIGSIQERVDLVHTFGVVAGRINYQTMVDACSTQAARIFGMYPRKGDIAIGSDADLVVYDPNAVSRFCKADSLSALDYCAYEGMERVGRCETVTLRGRIVARNGKYIGGVGGGRYLPRTPSHFAQ